jgi:hypothetical protein
LTLFEKVCEELHGVCPNDGDVAELSRMDETLSGDLVMDVLGDLDSNLHTYTRPIAHERVKCISLNPSCVEGGKKERKEGEETYPA